jgi:hypothetical protein
MGMTAKAPPPSRRQTVQWQMATLRSSPRVVILTAPQLQRAERVPFMGDSTPSSCSAYVPLQRQGSFFPDPRPDVTDEEVIHAFRIAIQRGGRLPRLAELYLGTVCAEHLVRELREQGLEVVRQPLGT